MGKSNIEWTDYTFNPWIGCAKVSAGCQFCYAETLMDTRYGRVEWGPNGSRVRTSPANWKKPLAWNRQAKSTGMDKVFCASLADVFEDRPELEPWRQDLFSLITDTPHLKWLLLTKRPENVNRMIKELPQNVWLGTSVENQETADERIPHLLKVPATVRFLSCEPLLGPVNLTHMDVEMAGDPDWCRICCLTGEQSDMGRPCRDVPTVHWVIAGGESGHNARPMHPEWVRSMKDQCVEMRTPFFFKQWGEWVSEFHWQADPSTMRTNSEFVTYVNDDGQPCDQEDAKDYRGEYMVNIGKKKAGRLLDGREWNEFPEVP